MVVNLIRNIIHLKTHIKSKYNGEFKINECIELFNQQRSANSELNEKCILGTCYN